MTDHPEEARIWADHRSDWAQSARTLMAATRDAFIVLNEIQFDTPWRRLRDADAAPVAKRACPTC
jgi:hypothetical protein